MAGGHRRILVIEDDPETAEQIVDSLTTGGYQVDLAVDGNDGLSRASSADYAVMTIDRMLPAIDGLAVIRRLREDGIVTPALIISALGEIDDRVRGLRAGGDDYLVKPFAFAELLARVEALARRSATVVKETVLRVGDLELDLVTRTVRRHGREAVVRKKLGLALLSEKPGEERIYRIVAKDVAPKRKDRSGRKVA
jgi:two-component system OmpR family response regulator